MSWWAQQGQKTWKTRRNKCDGSFSWSSMKPSTIINQIKAYSCQRVHPHYQKYLKVPRKFWDNTWRTNKKETLGREEYGERKKFFRTHWMVLCGTGRQWLKSRTSTQRGFFQGNVSLPWIQISLHFVCWRQIWKMLQECVGSYSRGLAEQQR